MGSGEGSSEFSLERDERGESEERAECSSLPPPPNVPISVSPGERSSTVNGVALEPGERVIFFARANHATERVVYIALGLLFAPLIFGVFLVAYGILYSRWHLRFVVLTTRRIITQKGRREPRWLFLRDVVDVRAKRDAAVSTVARRSTAAASLEEAKADPKYWANTEVIIVQGKKGALSIDKSVHPAAIGPALAKALYKKNSADDPPTAAHPR